MSEIAQTVMLPTSIRDVFFSEVGWDTDLIGFRGFCQPHRILVCVVYKINPRLFPAAPFSMSYALLC
jgi:hypothetical protein